MLFLTLLTGCASGSRDKISFENWRADFISAETHEITAVVTCTGTDSVSEYTLSYRKTAEGEYVEVLDDELIAGVTAHIENDKTELLFDGVVLETGSSLDGSLSPVSALPMLMDGLTEGYVKTTGRQKRDGEELLVTELEMADASRIAIWQKQNSMEPVFATIRSGESVDITISFTQIQ
jgi:hypothetical protein